MKKIIALLTLLLPLFSIAQETGIKWTTGLSWEQVKAKAKAENKYIFVDCYATWCVPCKKMDKEVYTNDTVGALFNNKFVSVKIQMDKTKRDNEFVQSWYEVAESLNKKYRIEGYPSFIFFSPQGEIVHKDLGYKEVRDLVGMGQIAIKPGKVYDDPYAEYDRLVADYKQGVKNYEKMPYMINIAIKLRDKDFEKQLLNEHTEYVAGLSAKERYTKEVIELWASYLLSSKGKRFGFFYNDGEIIDKIMNVKGFSALVVDRTIQEEVVNPFFKKQHGGSAMDASGGMMGDPRMPVQADYSEANWDDLYNQIRQKFNLNYADRSLITAKMEWYKKHNNYSKFASTYAIKLKKYGMGQDGESGMLNENAWQIFRAVTDEKVLDQIIPWMEKLVKQYPNYADAIDTYANLLYKSGKIKLAIEWQKKAVDAAKSDKSIEFKVNEYAEIVEQMKREQPTHLNDGAIWEGIVWTKWDGVKFWKRVYVTDAENHPLPGMSITIKKINQLQKADEQGRAVLNVSVGDLLVVSGNGFVSQELVINKNVFPIVIVLQRESNRTEKIGVNYKPPIDFSAVDNWSSIGTDKKDISISNDGKYFAYNRYLNSQYPQLDSLVIQSTRSAWRRAFFVTNPGFFTGDSKHYIFLQRDSLCFLRTGGQPRYITNVNSYQVPANQKNEWLAYQYKNNASTVVLHNLTTGNEQSFSNILSYSFDNTSTWLACQMKNDAKELMIHNINTNLEMRFKGVISYVFDAIGKVLVLKAIETTKANDTITSLKYVNLLDKKIQDIWSTSSKNTSIYNYIIDESGKQIVFMVKTYTSENQPNQSNNSIWYYRTGMNEAVLRVNDQTPGMESDYFIEGMSFFGGSKQIMLVMQAKPEFQQAQQEFPNISLWSYKDTVLHSAQQLDMYKKANKYLGVLSVEGGPLMRLENDYERIKAYNGEYAIVAKMGKSIYGDRFWEPGQKTDCNWLISLKDGSRVKELISGNERESFFWFSPGGKYLVYFNLNENHCHYFSINLETKRLVKISTGISDWQLGKNERLFHPNKPRQRAGVMGWLEGDAALLVYDDYDIWQLDLTGNTPPMNITNEFGRKHKIKLGLSGSQLYFDHNVPVFRMNDTLLLRANNMTTMYNGFYRTVLGKARNPELLYMGACVLEMSINAGLDRGMSPLKAKNANVWIVKRQTTMDPPNYYLTSDFKNYKSLTDLKPQRRFNWFTSDLHSFKQLDGTISEGVLYKPENFDSTKKYPVIISYYYGDEPSRTFYQFIPPSYLHDPISDIIPWFVSRGYLVFKPDIYINGNSEGESGLNTVEGASHYLKLLSFVDSNSLGACGHSASGRMTHYIYTHSKSFAGVVAGSSITDLISANLSLRYGMNEPTTVPYGNIWQNKDLLLEESPIMSADKAVSPLLMFHNTQDVYLNQPIEMFIALRRLQKKVWWLQYDDSHALIDPRNMKDFSIRYTQFFNHYLKSAPATIWMTKGIPARLKGIENGYAYDPAGNCGKDCKVCKAWNEKMRKDSIGTMKELEERKISEHWE